jgi:hypothetical protein
MSIQIFSFSHLLSCFYNNVFFISADVFLMQAEEKMRLLISKNSKRLKLLDQKGAEPQKIDATRNLLRKLSTKIRIAVRVIAKISRKINKLRDEELWPQVNALIQGYAPLLAQGECLSVVTVHAIIAFVVLLLFLLLILLLLQLFFCVCVGGGGGFLLKTFGHHY